MLPFLWAAKSVTMFHFLFPDPWPKRRHWSRRTFQPAFLQSMHKALVAGGDRYPPALRSIWDALVQRRLSLTGGIGASLEIIFKEPEGESRDNGVNEKDEERDTEHAGRS